MTNILRVVVPCLGILAGSAPCLAQINAPGARTLFNRGVLVRSFVKMERRSSPSADGAARQEITRYLTPLAVVYGFAPRWSATAVLPFVTRTGNRGSLTDVGMSDSRIFFKYDGLVARNWVGGASRVASEIGFQLPTGDDTFGRDGYDLIATVTGRHVNLRHWVSGDIQRTWTGEGRGDVNPGNILRYDLAYQYRVLPVRYPGVTVYLVGEVNGQWQGRARVGGARVPDTGHHVLFLAPGIQVMPTDRTVFEVSWQIPAYQDFSGLQPEFDWRIHVGFRLLFAV